LLWLVVLLGGFAALAALGGVIRPEGSVLVMVAALPVVGAWTWWTQHLLLGGRVGWRPLLPGAVTMTLGLYALRVYGTLSLSSSISGNYERYGPIGIVFTLLSWFIGFCVVMLGGAVVGAELWDARQRRLARQEPGQAIERIRRSVRRSQ
jgi:membrane protein